MLERLIDEHTEADTAIPKSGAVSQKRKLRKIRRYLAKGGFEVFAGSVVDQDGESAWHLSSRISTSRNWTDWIATVSYETPRIYKVKVTKMGFGQEVRIVYEPARS